MQARLKVMTPLLGTKNPSAPVGDKSVGDTRAARSLLSCELWRAMGRLWRGMGGMGRPEPLSAHHPRQQQRLSGFHESRLLCFPTHHFPLFPTISRHFPAPPTPPLPIKCPRAVRLSWSAARTAAPRRATRSLLRCAPFALHGAAWSGMERQKTLHPRQGPRTIRRSPSASRRTPNETMLRKGNILL